MASDHQHNILEWVIGGITTAFLSLYGWLNSKINRTEDKKLSKNQFEEYRIASDNVLQGIKEDLKEIKDSDKDAHDRIINQHDKILDKLDDKQDK